MRILKYTFKNINNTSGVSAQRDNKMAGFTIIELLIVVVIIGILSLLALNTVNGIQESARDAGRKNDIAILDRALEAYYVDNGHYPETNPATCGATTPNPFWCNSVETIDSEGSWILPATDPLAPYLSTPIVDPSGDQSATFLPATDGSRAYFYVSRNFSGHPEGPQWYMIVAAFEDASGAELGDGVVRCGDLGFVKYSGSNIYTDGADCRS